MTGHSERTANDTQRVWRNWMTEVGMGLAGVAFLFILSFLFFDIVNPHPSPYIGLFTYLVFPGFVVLGLVLAVVGLVRARRRLRERYGNLSKMQYYPRIDLNLPGHRKVLAALMVGAASVLPLIGVMSYEGYHYTDSNEFCGGVCHTVMAPQYTAHRSSPHARVDCAACHIGRGASWYVKSKLSGLRQVVAVASASYPRPIPPAIIDLRPARETCEQCHWPEKFYGDQLITIRHYASDKMSTPRTIEMFVKTGGSDPTTGPLSGIHWHMALHNTIEFVALDEELQTIPWVRSTDRRTQKTAVYRSDGKPVGDPPPEGLRRTMDCMDCHNRATHVFRSLQRSADETLAVNPELRDLPYVKRELVRALATPYESRSRGADGVANALRTFYESNHGEFVSSYPESLEQLVDAARDIYRRTFFPNMNVDWRTYPNNIGHKDFPGCFRCHAGDHVDDGGNEISSRCDACHDFLTAQNDDPSSLVVSGRFAHPVELAGVHAELLCSRCHTGGPAPANTCEGCHRDVVALREGSTPELESFGIEADVMDGSVDCTDCHDLDEPLTAVKQACVMCHDDDYAEMLEVWRSDYASLSRAAEADQSSDARAALRALGKAGPLHNIEAVRAVLRALADGMPVAAGTETKPR